MPYRDEAVACPACREPMARPNVAVPAGIVACRACGGTWADLATSQMIAASEARELEAIDNEASGAVAVPSGPRICPVCNEPLASVVFAQTELDACVRHGTFFDHAELGRVVRILERKRQLADPRWSSGSDMRWVNGTTGLTKAVLTPEELKEHNRAADPDLRALLGKLWAVVTKH